MRNDFDEENRIVRMKKWQKEFSFIWHDSFVDLCTMGHDFEAPKKLFHNAFKYESRFQTDERNKRDKNRKEMEKRRKK